jgi:isocitrate dehydrogenase kinase/phosphatase
VLETAAVSSEDAIARTILEGFDKHYRLFRETSTTAKGRFERSDWPQVREASKKRIDMYDRRVEEAVDAMGERFPDAGRDDTLWPSIKRAYIGMLLDHKQPECAETFFNSVARRVLHRRYYRNEYIFTRPAISTEHLDGDEPTYRCYYPPTTDLRETFWDILHSFDLKCPFADVGRDLDCVIRALGEHEHGHPETWERHPNFQVHVLSSLFFRNKAAYVIGRLINGSALIPFVMPLLKDDAGCVYVDTILLDVADVGRLFSLARAYFMVDMEVPSAYIDFLQSLVPSKPRAELYTLVGLQKQGKTLFFRDLEQHLKHSSDRFVLAPGTKGMVMLVFTLPSYPYVFKVIRDWFSPPKDVDRAHVEDRYRFVKLHDRVGRMADSLEYAHVAFPRARFEKPLVDELLSLAPSQVKLEDERLVIEHVYIERRMTPLDLFLATADEPRAREAIVEYGHAIKDLAGANIFPGDLLLKNFGITRYGRVVFYDYDELCELTECRFRRFPTPRTDDEEMSSEPWFSVEPNDVFPEQFPTFLFPEGRARDIFLEAHGDLADASFWSRQQERLRAGLQEDLYPYAHERRFSVRYDGGCK